jgi:hypothetical protein
MGIAITSWHHNAADFSLGAFTRRNATAEFRAR